MHPSLPHGGQTTFPTSHVLTPFHDFRTIRLEERKAVPPDCAWNLLRLDDTQHLHTATSLNLVLVILLPVTSKAVLTSQLLGFDKVLQSCGDR